MEEKKVSQVERKKENNLWPKVTLNHLAVINTKNMMTPRIEGDTSYMLVEVIFLQNKGVYKDNTFTGEYLSITASSQALVTEQMFKEIADVAGGEDKIKSAFYNLSGHYEEIGGTVYYLIDSALKPLLINNTRHLLNEISGTGVIYKTSTDISKWGDYNHCIRVQMAFPCNNDWSLLRDFTVSIVAKDMKTLQEYLEDGLLEEGRVLSVTGKMNIYKPARGDDFQKGMAILSITCDKGFTALSLPGKYIENVKRLYARTRQGLQLSKEQTQEIVGGENALAKSAKTAGNRGFLLAFDNGTIKDGKMNTSLELT